MRFRLFIKTTFSALAVSARARLLRTFSLIDSRTLMSGTTGIASPLRRPTNESSAARVGKKIIRRLWRRGSNNVAKEQQYMQKGVHQVGFEVRIDRSIFKLSHRLKIVYQL